MPKVVITEYAHMGRAASGTQAQAAQEPSVRRQVLDLSAGEVKSQTFNDTTRLVRVYADRYVAFAVGINPTATTSDTPISANGIEYFGLESHGLKISVIPLA